MFNEAYIIMLPIEVIPIAFIYCDLVMYAYIQFKSGSYAELIMLYSDDFSTSWLLAKSLLQFSHVSMSFLFHLGGSTLYKAF